MRIADVLPHESIVAEDIQKQFRAEINFAEAVLALALRIIGQDESDVSSGNLRLGSTKGISPRTIFLFAGLYAKACKQLRSILALCSLGLTDDAEVLARSLFETQLAIEFLLKPRLILKRGGAKLPIPEGWPLTTSFRAELYLAHLALEDERALAEYKKTRGLEQFCKYLGDSNEILRAAADARRRIGDGWTKLLEGSKKYAGVSIKDLAGSLGLLSYYVSIYRKQCGTAHAADAMNHFHVTDLNQPFILNLGPTTEMVGSLLVRSAGTFLPTIGTVNRRLKLGFDDEIAAMKKEFFALIKRQ